MVYMYCCCLYCVCCCLLFLFAAKQLRPAGLRTLDACPTSGSARAYGLASGNTWPLLLLACCTFCQKAQILQVILLQLICCTALWPAGKHLCLVITQSSSTTPASLSSSNLLLLLPAKDNIQNMTHCAQPRWQFRLKAPCCVADREAKAVWILLHQLADERALANARWAANDNGCTDARQVHLHQHGNKAGNQAATSGLPQQSIASSNGVGGASGAGL